MRSQSIYNLVRYNCWGSVTEEQAAAVDRYPSMFLDGLAATSVLLNDVWGRYAPLEDDPAAVAFAMGVLFRTNHQAY